MIRKTVLAVAAAATLAVATGATASTASAGAKVQFNFGFPGYGYGPVYHAPYPYYAAPVFTYHSCPTVVVGYKKVHTHHGWKTRPIYRRHCGY